MRIVVLGLAGAGKGTQAQMLAERLDARYVSSGDLFRHYQTQGTEQVLDDGSVKNRVTHGRSGNAQEFHTSK